MRNKPLYFSRYFKDIFHSALLLCLMIIFMPNDGIAQNNALWHHQEREIHYRPEGENFVCINGARKFNRALYGTNTAYRTEAGDLPEFAMYMPGMGGNLKFGVIKNGESKWLASSASIKAIYQPGAMAYEIQDAFLGNGKLKIRILSRASAEGLIVKIEGENLPQNMQLVWAFGGATGKKFSRDGDIGADPESVFYLHADNCADNVYTLNKDGFTLKYGSGKIAPTAAQRKTLVGVFPKGNYEINDAEKQTNPLTLLQSKAAKAPVFSGKLDIKNKEAYFFSIFNPLALKKENYKDLKEIYADAEAARQQLANRVKINTPDAYINTLGGALAMAADAIWESPTYLHGAVAWRMRLNAWRGAYVSDVLGWHDRAKLHFASYANSQVLTPESGPITPDTSRNFARQKEEMGTAMFSSGYISRNPNANNKPHHYDMNLVFFDQMFNYFNWTGDINFLKEMWPTLQRHLAWEKRNFDSDGDGLYDAYAAIWASDALQYSGGGVTHTSAYNFRANTEMARLAKMIGQNPQPYQQEADYILKAMQQKLWMPALGTYAEFQDLLGNKLLHTSPGLWTIYHAMDSKVPDSFQAYQSLKYINHQIPHIPIQAKGLKDEGYYTLSTTNWQPYTWSINNVALAELLHTSLAYWQGGQDDEAFKLWKSALIESMYLGASPGNFQQLSFYDAMRGELYRDFADPIGMAGRSLVEGLFGVLPDAMNGKLLLRPGLPQNWDYASLAVPDISIDFKRSGNTEVYTIVPSFQKDLELTMQLKVHKSSLQSIKVNGKNVKWTLVENSIDYPEIKFSVPYQSKYVVKLVWGNDELAHVASRSFYGNKDEIEIKSDKASLISIYDPQNILKNNKVVEGKFKSTFKEEAGEKTIFAQLKQNNFIWWQAINFNLKKPLAVKLDAGKSKEDLIVTFSNNTHKSIQGDLLINEEVIDKNMSFSSGISSSYAIHENLIKGSNRLQIVVNGKNVLDTTLINWNINANSLKKLETLPLNFNANLNHIFKQQYLSPRPNAVTLQLPTQGIGNWCYPLIQPDIDDAGLRKSAAENGLFYWDKIPFATPSQKESNNILFTSIWDNYPDSIHIATKGKAKHAYFLMAGTTNPMQSRIENAVLKVNYKDGTCSVLSLRNPENWWPIEQDYAIDGFAFTTDAPKPPRISLKSGKVITEDFKYKGIKGFSDYGIEGGAATVLDLPLNDKKEIKDITLTSVANDVVIGLMAITLER